MTTITSQLAVLFHETVGTDQYKESFVLLIPMEADREVRWLWTITSGIFSLAAVATAFAIRQARLNRFDWFDLELGNRERTFLDPIHDDGGHCRPCWNGGTFRR